MSTRQSDDRPGTAPAEAGSWLARAWLGVALIPVSFFVAFAVGEGAYAVLGYQPENADAPLWVVVVTSVLVLLVVIAPCATAVHYGRRAMTVDRRRGVVPLAIGWLVGAGAVVLTVVSEVGNALRG